MDNWALKPTYPKKKSFSSGFGHLILYVENTGICKILIRVKNKDTEISSDLGGTSPLISRLGDASSVPPLSTRMLQTPNLW